MKKSISVLTVLFGSIIFYVGCKPNSSENSTTVVSNVKEYVGSESCKTCHSQEYNLWLDSDHYHAMEIPMEKSVVGDFNNIEFTADGVSYFFFQKENDYLVTVYESDTITYKVKYTFGFEPLQQYLIETSNGKIQTLRATWDTEKKVWFHQRAGESIPKHDWLHWTNQAQNWNSMCASCHSTDLKKNYNKNNDTYNTTYSEINVGCEACHGQGSEHIKIAESKEVTPEHTGLFAKAKNNVKQVEQCAPCHARRTELTKQFQMNIGFLDQFMPQTINNVFYEKDGQILEEDYVYASFASSKMYHETVKCNDCHNPHSNQLKLSGNLLCQQCHEPKYEKKEHHFHEINTESSQCVNCHMTGKEYMGNDHRRDHSFRIPRPDQSAKYGTSNACNECHDNKSASWAATQVEEWYGKERPDHFSNLLLPGQDGNLNALIELIENNKYPAIARATAIEYLRNFPLDGYYTYLNKWGNDKEGLVRLELVKLCFYFPQEMKVSSSAKFLDDPLLAVRMAAFRNLIGEYDNLNDSYKPKWKEIESDYIEFLNHNSDFREGQLNYAQYYTALNNDEMAKTHFQNAIEIDSFYTEPYSNLAIIQNKLGENDKALETLDKLILRDKEAERGYYLRGLLHAENNDYTSASKDLEKAIELNPNPTYYYNAILIERKQYSLQKANKYLIEALTLYPNDARLNQLKNN